MSRSISLWTKIQVQQATRATSAEGDWQASSVGIDSRAITPGMLFIALAGERFDGHDFVAGALAAGAVGAIVQHTPAGMQEGDSRLLYVDDTTQALQALAVASRARFTGKVVGITGSVGKTSTKQALQLALQAVGECYATRGNYNNHIGVPLTLANMPAQADYAVIEMGMNHAGEIAALSALARPHVALITTIESAHIEFFDSVADIAHAKAEIATGLEPECVVLLPADSPYLPELLSDMQHYQVDDVRLCGCAREAAYRLIALTSEGLATHITVEIMGVQMQLSLPVLGEHYGVLAAQVLGVVHALQADLPTAAMGLARYHEPEGRGRVYTLHLPDGVAYLLDDSYNASPASMRMALQRLVLTGNALGSTRLLAALGDMLELGEHSTQEHLALAAPVEAANIDTLWCAGVAMQHLAAVTNAIYVPKASDLVPDIISALRAGDILLVKGSHGSNLYTVAQALREAYQAVSVAGQVKTHDVATAS